MSRPVRPLTSTVALLVATVLILVAPDAALADKVRDEQWQLDTLDAKSAWTEATGAGVTVAVIDSGVDGSHPDLAGQVLPGLDLVDPGGDGQTDPVGHGTAIAAFIAGRDDDGDGVVGLAPAAKILPVRVLNRQNRYDDPLVVAKGVQWAVDHGATVINLSLGGASYDSALADAVEYALARDVVVIACTGNLIPGESREVWYPAREPGVVAVAGLDGRPGPDPLWAQSLTGPATVLVAPATDMIGAQPGGRYWEVRGTSFATPLVSATTALIRSKWPRMSAPNVIQRLTQTARDLGVAGRDDRYGFGAVDPVVALRAPIAEVTANPLGSSPPRVVARFGPASEPVPEPTRAAPRPSSHRGRASAVDLRAPGSNAPRRADLPRAKPDVSAAEDFSLPTRI